MDAARFSFEPTDAGWRLASEERSLEGPLEGVFRYELRVDDIPHGVPLVGHCRVMGLWCIFAREPDGVGLVGAALRPDAYAGYAFDPFVAGAELLGSAALAQVVATSSAAPVADGDEGLYDLAAAYRVFTAGPTATRQSLYCSILPAGCPRRVSPLTGFVVGRAQSGTHDTPPPLTSAEPPPKLAAPPPGDAAAEPDATADGMDEPAEEPSPGEAPARPMPDAAPAWAPASDLRLDLCSLEARVLQLEQRVSHHHRRLLALLAALALVLAAAVAASWLWTARRLARPEATNASRPASAPAELP